MCDPHLPDLQYGEWQGKGVPITCDPHLPDLQYGEQQGKGEGVPIVCDPHLPQFSMVNGKVSVGGRGYLFVRSTPP